MFGGNRGRLSAALCVGTMAALVAAGCGSSDDESTANEEPVDVSAATEPADTFINRMTKLVETTSAKKECAELETINSRSVTRFPCPAPKSLRTSMGAFELVGAQEYGTGAVVDYKSGKIKDGAAILLYVAPDRNWAISRFGIASKPSTETSDDETRAGYRKAVDEFLTSIRERDCDSYVAVTYNGDDKKDVVCRETFPGTKKLAKVLKRNPSVEPRYEGGNASYGFYSVETPKPTPANFTISIAKATADGPRPYVVLDITPSPTSAQQKKAQKAFEKERKQKSNQGMEPSSKPSDPAVTTP